MKGFLVFVSIILHLHLPRGGEATFGVDVSSSVSTSSWECLVGEGVQFAIVRSYRSTGSVDPNAAATIANAKAAGVKYVDGYIFPCYSCGDGAGQVKDCVENLEANGVGVNATTSDVNELAIGMLWLDIEGTQYWGSSTSSNVDFISDMVNEANKLGVTVAFYTSESQWTPITGGSTKFSSSYQLWYAHYDGSASFSDFAAFGGWSSPAMKQYDGDRTLCSTDVDYNYY